MLDDTSTTASSSVMTHHPGRLLERVAAFEGYGIHELVGAVVDGPTPLLCWVSGRPMLCDSRRLCTGGAHQRTGRGSGPGCSSMAMRSTRRECQ